jgi:RimJ/RimL family protein N-acetyltransferase
VAPAAPRSARLDAEAPDPDLHLGFAARQLADPRIARWHWPGELGGPRTREQVRGLLEWQAERCAAERFAYWWWRERATGELVGMAGLNRDQVEEEPVVEVGWSITPACQRRGFATEAAIASIAWGFEVCGLKRIVSFSLPENLASRGVMERAGLTYVRDFERKGFPQVLYAIGLG